MKPKTIKKVRSGMSYTKFYGVWETMKGRCLNKNHMLYRYYGKRGISICYEWVAFKGFYDDMFPTYKEGLTLDRIDNNKGYSKENCRWATRLEQVENRNCVKKYKYFGKKMTLRQWSEYLDISRTTLYSRLTVLKWSIEKSFRTPIIK